MHTTSDITEIIINLLKKLTFSADMFFENIKPDPGLKFK